MDGYKFEFSDQSQECLEPLGITNRNIKVFRKKQKLKVHYYLPDAYDSNTYLAELLLGFLT